MFYPWSLWPCCILFGQWPAILQRFICTIHFDERYRLSNIFQQFGNEHLATGGILFYTSCINGTVLSLVPRASFFSFGALLFVFLFFLHLVESSRCRRYNEHFVAWQKRQPQHIDMHEISMQLTIKKKMEDTSLRKGKMCKMVITPASGKIHSSMDADWSQFSSRFRQVCIPGSHENYFSQRLEQLGQRFSAELLNGLTYDALRWFDRSKSLGDFRCV